MTPTAPGVWDSLNKGDWVAVVTMGGAAGEGESALCRAAVAWEGDGALLRLDQLGPFLEAHREARLICLDAGIIDEALAGTPGQDGAAGKAIWGFARRNRLLDAILMTGLLRRARGESRSDRQAAASDLEDRLSHAGCERGTVRQVFERLDPCLLRGRPPIAQGGLPPPSDQDLLAFVKALLVAGRSLHGDMERVRNEADVCREVAERFGPLALGIQVGARLATHLHAREGVRFVDLAAARAGCERRCHELLRQARSSRQVRVWLKETFKNREPDVIGKVHRKWTGDVHQVLRDGRGICVASFLRGEERNLNVEFWEKWAWSRPGLTEWARLKAACKLWRDLERAEGHQVVGPEYEILPCLRCRKFNLELLREGSGKGLAEPPPGYLFLRARLSDLHLRALAAVCHDRCGHSSLTEVLQDEKQDPWSWLAARLEELDDDAFLRLQMHSPEDFERGRQRARVLLALAPMGLDSEGVSVLARSLFEVELGAGEAKGLVCRLREVCPEVDWYLQDTTWECMGRVLDVPAAQLQEIFPGVSAKDVAATFQHQHFPFPVSVFDIHRLPRGPRSRFLAYLPVPLSQPSLVPLTRLLGEDRFGAYRRLTDEVVVTRTGRVRAGACWIQARHETAHDLADDALKRALFAVVDSGFWLAGIEDDGLVVAVETQDLDRKAKALRQLVVCSAGEVLTPIRVDCKIEVLDQW